MSEPRTDDMETMGRIMRLVSDATVTSVTRGSWYPKPIAEAILAAQAETRAALLVELRAKVEALTGTVVLDGRGIGTIHEPTRAAVLALFSGDGA